MKKLLTVILLLTFVIGFAGLASASPDWRIATGDKQIDHYFDTQSFKTTGPQTYSVGVRMVYALYFGLQEANRLGYDNPLGQIISTMEYNHANRTARILSTTYYDVNGTVIHASEVAESWKSNASYRSGKVMFNKTYEFYKNNYK